MPVIRHRKSLPRKRVLHSILPQPSLVRNQLGVVQNVHQTMAVPLIRHARRYVVICHSPQPTHHKKKPTNLNTPPAAQKCQNYWKGHAAFCNPSGACDSDAYKWWGIISDRGDGDRCLTGYKHLCQCVAAGSLDACVAQAVVATPQLKGMFTTCNNGCSLWVCGIYGLKFYKRDSSPAAPVEEEEKMSGRLLLRKRRMGNLHSIPPLLPLPLFFSLERKSFPPTARFRRC